MLRPALLLVFLSLLAPATGQDLTRYSDRVTLTDGSELRGQIQVDGEALSGEGIRFRPRSGGPVRMLTPATVLQYRLARRERTFLAVDVEIPDPLRAGVSVIRRRFGEQLSTGDVALIKVPLRQEEYLVRVAETKPYVYLLRFDDNELLLRLTTIEVYGRLHANPSRFRNILKYVVRDCPLAVDLARIADFKDTDLLGVLRAYADCRQGRTISIAQRRLRGGLRFEHVLRVQYLNIRDAAFSSPQFSAGFGYQVGTVFSDRFRRLSLLGSVDIIYHTYQYQGDVATSQTMLKGNLSVAYAPVLRDKFRLQVVGGLCNYNAVASNLRSFFNNNYFMLNGGLRATSGNWVGGVSYEHLPNQNHRRPGSLLAIELGYRLPL